YLSAQARRGEARAPHLISRRSASKRRRLGARPSPGTGRFGRAPGLYNKRQYRCPYRGTPSSGKEEQEQHCCNGYERRR
ncbi:hypothetical protein B296_00051475, partial [Ensete ventricosum]